jgi:4-amino-4-deoxy-L-arabinose transferase-like glycosyltransferase
MSSLVWNRETRKRGVFLLTFSFFSFLAICPGFFFRPHYYVLLLPVTALLVGVAASSLSTAWPGSVMLRGRFIIGLLIGGLALTVNLFQHRAFLFQMTPSAACRSTYGLNAFPESLEIADYIREHTGADDRIAVIGSEPQIYFYARRLAATGYIYTYSMMEYHDYALKMQEQMIDEIQSADPEYIVYFDPGSMPWSWAAGKKSHRYLIEWFNRYKNRHYTRVGLVEVYRQKANYRWGVEALGAPQSRHWIEVLQRKKDRNLLGV